jgi:hypothetical protein
VFCRETSRGQYFEHLNESNVEIQVCLVATNQTGAVKDTDGDDGSEVEPAGHFHLFAAIKQVASPGQDLGHDRGEKEMPTC